MRAVFLDYDTVSNGDLDTSSLKAVMPDIELHGATDDAQVTQRIATAEVVMLNKYQLTRALITGAQHLTLVALAATGTDNVDLAAARERGIGVCNVRGYCSQSVMQQVWAMILDLTQHVRGYGQLVRDGSWVRNELRTVFAYPIRELSGRTFGVVGWGDLGKAAAKGAEVFGMRVIIANRSGGERIAGRVDLDRLLAESDVVSLHCPLTPATRGLIGARELALMKPDALLINPARGGLIDGLALASAL